MPLAGQGHRPAILCRRASRPQLKRDPLGSCSPPFRYSTVLNDIEVRCAGGWITAVGWRSGFDSQLHKGRQTGLPGSSPGGTPFVIGSAPPTSAGFCVPASRGRVEVGRCGEFARPAAAPTSVGACPDVTRRGSRCGIGRRPRLRPGGGANPLGGSNPPSGSGHRKYHLSSCLTSA